MSRNVHRRWGEECQNGKDNDIKIDMKTNMASHMGSNLLSFFAGRKEYVPIVWLTI